MPIAHSLLHILTAGTYLLAATVLACPSGAPLPVNQSRTDWLAGPTFINVTYANNSPGIRNMLDVFTTKASWEAGAPSAPCVVFIHGGGWRGGEKEVPDFLKEMLGYGITAVGIGYRLSQEAVYPAQIIDVENAVKFLKDNAATYRIDPTRIIAMGSSAGGHLASLLSTRNGPSSSARVLGLVDFYGPVLINDTNAGDQILELLGCNTPGQEDTQCGQTATEGSPMTHVASDNPSTLILQGKQDTTTPWQLSLAFRDELQKKGVDVNMILNDNAGHSKTRVLFGKTLGKNNNEWLNKWIVGTFITCGSPSSYEPLAELVNNPISDVCADNDTKIVQLASEWGMNGITGCIDMPCYHQTKEVMDQIQSNCCKTCFDKTRSTPVTTPSSVCVDDDAKMAQAAAQKGMTRISGCIDVQCNAAGQAGEVIRNLCCKTCSNTGSQKPCILDDDDAIIQLAAERGKSITGCTDSRVDWQEVCRYKKAKDRCCASCAEATTEAGSDPNSEISYSYQTGNPFADSTYLRTSTDSTNGHECGMIVLAAAALAVFMCR